MWDWDSRIVTGMWDWERRMAARRPTGPAPAMMMGAVLGAEFGIFDAVIARGKEEEE